VSVVILIILAAISVPTLLQAYRSYQLSDAASKLSGMMKTTRFSAIRKNTPINCQIQPNGTAWTVWADLDGDNNVETTERRFSSLDWCRCWLGLSAASECHCYGCWRR